MKVMAVLGSPNRNGNSATLAEHFLLKSKEAGAETKLFFLEGMNYKGCKACMKCKSGLDKCAINDDLSGVLQEMHMSDIIVLASPNYFGDVSGQLKLFIDRTYSLLTPDFMTGEKKTRLAPGKHIIFIITQGASIDGFTDIPERIAGLNSFFGFESVHIVRGCELLESNAASQSTELLDQIDQLAETLLKK